MIYAAFFYVFFNVSYNEAGNFFFASIKKYFFVFIVAYWMGNFLFHKNSILKVEKENILHLFGKVTYGIYMFNPVIIYVTLQTFSRFEYKNYLVFILMVHALLAVACFLSYRFFEMPFLALKEKYAVVKSGGVTSGTPEIAVTAVPVQSSSADAAGEIPEQKAG